MALPCQACMMPDPKISKIKAIQMTGETVPVPPTPFSYKSTTTIWMIIVFIDGGKCHSIVIGKTIMGSSSKVPNAQMILDLKDILDIFYTPLA